MSSLHQDRLLVEGPEPVNGTGSTLASSRGTARRPAEEKAPSKVPTQRKGKAQRSGSAQTTTTGSATAPRSRRAAGVRAAAAATGTAGTLAARAKAAKTSTTKAATAKAATAKAATAKAATAAKTAAVAKVATRTANARTTNAAATAKSGATAAKATPAAKPGGSAAKPTPAAKPAATAKAATAAKASPAAKPAATAAKASPAAKPRTAAAKTSPARPTPYKRVPSAVEAASVAPAPELVAPAAPEVDEVLEASQVVAAVADGRRARFRRRPPSLRHRPALYLAAALVGAFGVSAISTGDPAAQATSTMSHSVSVAQELGIEAGSTEAIIDNDGTQRLEELAASRNERDAEQAAAAQAQAQADTVAAEAAAEAARPRAVLPVSGAQLTSTFGARWGTLHAGIDLAAPMRTPEMAAMDGIVLEAGPASGFGLAVYIQHENGDVTVYGHMDQILVQAGQVVRAGDTIALLGNRGQSTGPHLHFEVHVGGINGQKIDPLPWLRERGISI